MDEIKLEFLRQTLIGILIQDDFENLQLIFMKLGSSNKFSLFRESLKLFLLHFLFKNMNNENDNLAGKKSKALSGLSAEKLQLLKTRVELIDKVMMSISHGSSVQL